MPRTKPPPKLPSQNEVQIRRVRLSAPQRRRLSEVLGYPAAPRLGAIDAVTEILSDHQTALAIPAITPGSVAKGLRTLRKALEPFTSLQSGIDQETFDLLAGDAAALQRKIDHRLIALSKHPKLAGVQNELIRLTCPLLRLAWERFATREVVRNRKKRRQFVSIALEGIGAPHPNRQHHAADLDWYIDLPAEKV